MHRLLNTPKNRAVIIDTQNAIYHYICPHEVLGGTQGYPYHHYYFSNPRYAHQLLPVLGSQFWLFETTSWISCVIKLHTKKNKTKQSFDALHLSDLKPAIVYFVLSIILHLTNLMPYDTSVKYKCSNTSRAITWNVSIIRTIPIRLISWGTRPRRDTLWPVSKLGELDRRLRIIREWFGGNWNISLSIISSSRII